MGALRLLPELSARSGGGEVAALGPARTWDELAHRRGEWSAAFAGGPAVVALFQPDGFEFAAALLGAWAAGVGVVLPADESAATRTATSALAGAFWGSDALAPQGGPWAAPKPFPAVPVTVFTSGSGGEPVAAPKNLRCLDGELAALEALFGGETRGLPVLATVPHQHLYGLLFKILWPLASGRPFWAPQVRLPEEIAAAASAAGPCLLASSPALLKRIGGSSAALEALAPAKAALRGVFSSGGPLPWDAVRKSEEALGWAPAEIYGSSETGGVAWRRRAQEADPWLAFPDVETRVGADGILELRSGHTLERAWIRSDDRAVPVAGGFHLRGRADRIVKIEEKRVSLDALEAALKSQRGVGEAKVLCLKGPRESLGAVVLLEGTAPPDAAARRRLSLELRAALEGVADPVALPRRWRFVESLPVDAMGKTTAAALESLFGEEETLQPEILHVSIQDPAVELDLYLPASLRYFRGHFPGLPILPGVVQLHWAILYARERLGVRGEFKGLRALKFMKPIQPDRRIALRLEPFPGGFDFTYHSEAGKHAGGRVLLG